MRDNHGMGKGVAPSLFAHAKWRETLSGIEGVSFFLNISELPEGVLVLAPSEKAEKFFKSQGIRCLEVEDYDNVEHVVQKVKSVLPQGEKSKEKPRSKVEDKPSEETRVVKLKTQAKVVEFLEKYMENNNYYVYNHQVVHLTPSGLKKVDRDYLARDVIRHYELIFDGKDYIPADRLCGLALSGVSLKTISAHRNYPVYCPLATDSVLCPKVEPTRFTSKVGDILTSVESYFSVLGVRFKDVHSMASTLAALLTPLVYVPNNPIWVITSSTPGVGKTLLAQSVFALATGEIIPVTPYPDSDSEARKQITSALLSNRPALIWDNLSRPLGGPSIDALVTSRLWRDRILGRSQMVELTKFITLACTGNNVSLTADTYRRVYVTHLEPVGDKPESRLFTKDLVNECVSKHKQFVKDAMGWLAFYEKQGYVPQRGFGSFEQWNAVVGGFVEWLLGVHPADTSESIVSEDKELLERFLVNFPYGDYTSVEDILKDCQSTMFGNVSKEFVSTVKEITPKLLTKELSQWLMRHEGRVIAGKVITSVKQKGVRLYAVKEVRSV